MTPDTPEAQPQPPGLTHALLEVLTPLDHARSLLTPSLAPAVEPLRRGPWGVATLALRWPTPVPTDEPTAFTNQPAEVWAAAVRVRVMTDRLDVLNTHAPVHLASPSPQLRLTDASPDHTRVFPLPDAARHELAAPDSALTTDPDTQQHLLHRLRFEPITTPPATDLQRTHFKDEKGGLAWLKPNGKDPVAEAWLRWLGPGAWHGQPGEAVHLLQSGTLGGSLWGADQDASRLDTQPLIPPIAQIPIPTTPDAVPQPGTARVFVGS
ncbi:MAG: hypothetical protein AAF750_03985 [Planctomycetota bacterium]